jgi:hypothetical protein
MFGRLVTNNLKHNHASKLAVLALVLAILAYSTPPVGIAGQQEPPKPTGDTVAIPDGTDFTVLTTEELSSKTASENDPVNLKVSEDVKINNQVVIAKDTLVKGIVSDVEQRGHLGKGGKLGLRVESKTTVDGQKIKLRASKGKADAGNVGSTIALSLLISPLFLLRRGNHAKIKSGTLVKVYTDEEKKVVLPTPKAVE